MMCEMCAYKQGIIDNIELTMLHQDL